MAASSPAQDLRTLLAWRRAMAALAAATQGEKKP